MGAAGRLTPPTGLGRARALTGDLGNSGVEVVLGRHRVFRSAHPSKVPSNRQQQRLGVRWTDGGVKTVNLEVLAVRPLPALDDRDASGFHSSSSPLLIGCKHNTLNRAASLWVR
jgi:hypothetical protein